MDKKSIVPAISYVEGEEFVPGVLVDLDTDELLREDTREPIKGERLSVQANGRQARYSREKVLAATNRAYLKMLLEEGALDEVVADAKTVEAYNAEGYKTRADGSVYMPLTYDPSPASYDWAWITPQEQKQLAKMREQTITIKVGNKGPKVEERFKWEDEPLDDPWRESVRKSFRTSDLMRIYFDSDDPELRARAAAELWPEEKEN